MAGDGKGEGYHCHPSHKDYLRSYPMASWGCPSQPCRVDNARRAVLSLPDFLCPQVTCHADYLTPSMVAWYGLVTSCSVE